MTNETSLARTGAEEGLAALRFLAQRISHDLRSPLSVLLSFADLLSNKEAPSPEAAKDFTQALTDIRKLAELFKAVSRAGVCDSGHDSLTGLLQSFSSLDIELRDESGRPPFENGTLVRNVLRLLLSYCSAKQRFLRLPGKTAVVVEVCEAGLRLRVPAVFLPSAEPSSLADLAARDRSSCGALLLAAHLLLCSAEGTAGVQDCSDSSGVLEVSFA